MAAVRAEHSGPARSQRAAARRRRNHELRASDEQAVQRWHLKHTVCVRGVSARSRLHFNVLRTPWHSATGRRTYLRVSGGRVGEGRRWCNAFAERRNQHFRGMRNHVPAPPQKLTRTNRMIKSLAYQKGISRYRLTGCWSGGFILSTRWFYSAHAPTTCARTAAFMPGRLPSASTGPARLTRTRPRKTAGRRPPSRRRLKSTWACE